MSFDNRAILTDGGRYLEVCYRIEDAKREGCRTVSHLVLLDDTMAVFKAEVFNHAGRKLSEAYGSRASKFEPYYVEHAETAAIGRALSEAGYNIYTYELSDDLRDHSVTLDDEAEYVNVSYRVAKFRKEHPEAFVKKTILTSPVERLTTGIATVKVEVIEADVVISTAHAQRRYSDDERRRNFVECAETAAVGRALSILGYDLPPGAGNQFSDSADVADAPICGEEPKNPEPQAPTEPPAQGKPEERPAKAASEADNRQAHAPDKAERVKEAQKPAASSQAVQKDPESFVSPSGRYKGKTLGELWRSDWTYVRKLAYSQEVAKFAEPELVANAKAVCLKYGVKSGQDMFSAEKRRESEACKPAPAPQLSSYIIPSGKHKGTALGEIWDTNWQYVRMLAYDPKVAGVAEPELVANAKAYCLQNGVRDINGKPVDMMTHEELEEQLFGSGSHADAPGAGTDTGEVEKAGNVILTQGMKHPNEPIREIYAKDPSYVSWIAYKSGYGEAIKTAAKVYFEAHKK